MDEIIIFFLTSCPKDELKLFSILINGKKTSQYILDKKENFNILLNEMKLSNPEEKEIEIDYDLKYKNQKSSYIFKLKKEKSKYIYFIFNIKAETKNKDNIQTDSLFFIPKKENFIEDNLSKYEKFSYFYKYLLETKKNLFESESKKFYVELSLSFLKEIDYSNDLVPFDIIISILITYSQTLEVFLKITKDIKINLEDNNNIPIQNYEKIYLKGISYSLNNLLSMKDSNKNIILEIIMIYLIKFKNKDIDIILQENYINMLISLFHQNNLIYLKEEIIDEEMTQKIIQHIPQIENILGTYKALSKNYISYLDIINNNFDNLYKVIDKLKSLKGSLFEVDLEVSQQDDINKFSKLHQTMLERQKKRGKYFISFLPIIKKYYKLYKNYNNLNGLSELLDMLNLEINLFPTISKILKLKNEILIITKDLIKEKIKKKRY